MSIENDAEKHLITAICSREGETVALKTPIDLSQNPKINDWLHKLEQEMQATLAKQLADSLEHFMKFNLDSIKMDEYMQWIDTYPV